MSSRRNVQWKSKAHPVNLLLSSNEICMVPLNEEQLSRISFALRANYDRLVKSGDFPEKAHWDKLLSDIGSAMFLLSPMNPKMEE